jgi:Tol biopolymer transport system component
VSYPVLASRRMLMYIGADADDSGPWLYGMDMRHRIPHRLTSGLERYTSLSASADDRRLALTLASPKTTLWRMRALDSPAQGSAPVRVAVTTSTGHSPRLGPNYLLYVSSSNASDSVWKLTDGASEELWQSTGAQIIGAPAISPDGRRIAFSALQGGRKVLYAMASDGSNAKAVADSLDLQGSPAWTPDGELITTAANNNGVLYLYNVPVAGGSPALFVREYSTDPAWAAGERFVLYSGRDIGTTFSVKGATAEGAQVPLPALTLTRGARHLALLRGGNSLVVLRGEIQHKNLWVIDLKTGAQRQLTALPPDFDVRDFDISPDGREIVLERLQQRSDIVLMYLPQT